MLKVGDLVLWGINVNPAWRIVNEKKTYSISIPQEKKLPKV